MKKILKKIVPEKIILFYHYLQSLSAAFFYGFPAKKMIVIGVTGTKGKTSVINYIWSVLQSNGIKSGIISTANIRIGNQEMLNKYHMTMPGRFKIQKLLAEMLKSGCQYCMVETTSEGLKQFRHIGVYYDMAIFTNLTPEHLPSHGGSFENYKKAKAIMFKYLTKNNNKMIAGKKIDKVIIANQDSDHANFYLGFPANKRITFSIDKDSDFKAQNIKETTQGVDFYVKNDGYHSHIIGSFNVYNCLPAIIVGQLVGLSADKIKKGIKRLNLIPGRMEKIDLGQKFTVLVDYAHEEQSITNVLKTANNIKKENSKVIILLGAEGGGRDTAKRPKMGELAAKFSDYLIVSDVDPYEDDREQIIEDVAQVAEKKGMERNKNLFTIKNRRGGIKKALALAQEGDIILITGKGAEQSITIDGKKSYWDDRLVVKEELEKIIKKAKL